MKTCLTDWRGPGKWTKADRERKADIASVYKTWGTNPFGIRTDIRTLVGIPTAYDEYDGFAGTGFNAAIATEAKARGFDSIEGSRREQYVSPDGKFRTYCLNMAHREVSFWLADHIAEHFSWAHGIHLDYYTSMAWQFALKYPMPYWDKWDGGLMMLVHRLRLLRPDWLIVGQQFYLARPTHVLNGLFLEQYPTCFGMTVAQHEIGMMWLHHLNPKLEPCWIVELLHPETVPAWYVQETKDFCERTGAYYAAGRL